MSQSFEDVHTRNNKSFPHRRSSSVAIYLTGHLAAALLKKKFWIFPAVRDQRWCHPSTRRLKMDRDDCHFHRGGFIFEGKCRFENKPPPQSRSCLLLKKGGLIYGRIR